MSNNEKLPSSHHLNIEMGLKYLNNNEQLYRKVLQSFLTRYENFHIQSLNEAALKNNIHTIKGLALTLGMESLSGAANNLELSRNNHDLQEFSKILRDIIKDLKNFFTP